MSEEFKSDRIEKKQEEAIASEKQIKNKQEMKIKKQTGEVEAPNQIPTMETIQNEIQSTWTKAMEEKKASCKPMSEKERETTFLEQILGKEITEKVIFSAKECCDKEIEPMQWFVDNIIPYPDPTDNKTINMTGASGVGKTTLINYMMLCMVLNIPLFNDERFRTHNEEKFSIAVLSLEDGCKRMKRLLQQQWRALIARGIITKDQRPDIHYIFDDELFERTPDGRRFLYLADLMRTWDKPPIVIVIDSQLELNGLFGTSLNDNTDVTQSLRPFRELNKIFNCNSFIINHPQKNSSIYQDAQMRITGAGSQISASKSIMHLQKSNKKNIIELTFAKSTYMPEEFRNKKFILRRNDDCTFDLLDIKLNLPKDDGGESNNEYINMLSYANDLHDGGLSFTKVANKLNEEGKKTKSGFDWKDDNLRREVNRFKQGVYPILSNQNEQSDENAEEVNKAE